MADYSTLLTEIDQVLGELRWLLPDANWTRSRELARRLELCAAALANECGRKLLEQQDKLIGYTDAVGTDKPKASPMIYAHVGRAR